MYPTIGILNAGRGVFQQPDLLGAKTSYKKLFRVRAGQVVYSKLKAFEGSIAIVPDEFDGYFVSSEFPAFDVGDVWPPYLKQVLQSEMFTVQLRKASHGLGARRERVHPRDFLQITIPLPSSGAQRTIAARLDRVSAISAEMIADTRGIEAILDQRETSAINSALAQGTSLISDLATVNPPPRPVCPSETIHFVPMADLDESSGMILGVQTRERSLLGSGFKQFMPGDIVFARITPSMQNGKSAIFEASVASVGYGSTEFHVVRPHDPQQTRDIYTLLRSKWFRVRAMDSFSGTAGQQRVPADHLRNAQIPVLDQTKNSDLFQTLRDIEAVRRKIDVVTKRRQALGNALPQAARNAEFARLMS